MRGDGTLRFGCGISICEAGKERLAGWATLTEKDLRRVETRVLAEPGLAVMGLAKDRWGRIWIRDWQRMFVGESMEGPWREIQVKGAGGTNPPMLRLSPGGVMYFNATDGFFWGNAKGVLERAPGDEGENGGLHVAYWDRQGGIWIGRTGKGLLRREAAELMTRRWGKAEGLRDPVFGVHEWGGRMVAGTLRGVYELEAGERRWRALPETMGTYGGVPAMATARDGALLIGVNRGTPVLARVERDGRVLQKYHVPPVQDGPNVYSMLRDPRGFLWLGSARRLYRAVEKGREVETTPVELGVRPLGANVYAMQLDEKLRLLAPTSYGLFRVDGEKVERWGAKDGFRFDGVQYIGRDGRGGYWVSYQNKPGIARVEFAGTGIRVEHPAEEVGIGTVADILGDRRGWIWITDDRATWVNRTGGLGAGAFERVGENVPEMAKGGNSMSLLEDAAGRIWIGGAEGLARVEDPEWFVAEKVEAPPVTVSGLTFGGYAGEVLAARLSTSWLRGMDGVRFRWRMGGEWKLSEDGAVRMDAVPAGDFVLEAQAEDKEGAWRSAVVRVPVVSVVPWWRASWFWWVAGVGLLGVGGLVGGRWKRAREEAAAYAAAKLAYLEQQGAMPVFGGRYQGLAVIGTGAFATVYRAADELDGKEVAVKSLVAAAAVRKELDREVESLRRISHPGVVGILDYSIGEDGGAYLVLDYVPGPTLREVLAGGAMERGRVAVLARQLGEALGAAHAAGVIHRDLKPENIILRPEGEGERAVIVDFGIAVCKPPGATSARATSVGGTLFYLAPEQMGGAARPTADIYSFAVILCEALTGVCPEIVEEQGLERRAEAAGRLLAGDPVAELICGAMAYEAGLRPRDALAFGLAVEDVLLRFYGKNKVTDTGLRRM